MKLLGEMKRRNLFRVGMIYIAASWIATQLGLVVAGNFSAPDWVMQAVIVILLLGLPLVLYLAWTYEVTPDGVRPTAEVDPARSITRETGQRLDIVIMALLAATVAMAALEQFMPKPEGMNAQRPLARTAPAESQPRPDIEENSIAVLPFVNMSAEPDQDYFSNGMSEELLNVLAQVDGLNVASRTSSFAFKDDARSIQEIARALGVAKILEGSVRKSGNRLRITAQLIDAETDVHLWSDSYDRNLIDIFQVQDEIANAIVSALTAELGVGLESVQVRSATRNLDAYDLYLKAREMFIARENLPQSWELLEQATRMDPEFARAWEALAAVHSVATSWFPGDGIDHPVLALAAAHRALEIDPNLSMAHAVIGMKFQQTGEGYEGAIRNLDIALEKDPKNATGWLWRGITYRDMGYFEKALSDFERCLAVDADYLNCRQHRAEALLMLGRIDEAVAAFEATLDANFHSTDDAFVSHYVLRGQRNLALLLATVAIRIPFAPIRDWIGAIEHPDEDHSARVARFNEWGKDHNITVCQMDAVAVALKQEQCFHTVENARLMWLPDSAGFRKKPAFKNYVRAHLLDFWREHGFPPQCRELDGDDFECA